MCEDRCMSDRGMCEDRGKKEGGLMSGKKRGDNTAGGQGCRRDSNLRRNVPGNVPREKTTHTYVHIMGGAWFVMGHASIALYCICVHDTSLALDSMCGL